MKFSSFNFNKKIERKKFFITAAASFATYTVLRSFPFNLFNGKMENNKIEKQKRDMIKVHPLAVSRKNVGDNNV
jgi:hypothetical protein